MGGARRRQGCHLHPLAAGKHALPSHHHPHKANARSASAFMCAPCLPQDLFVAPLLVLLPFIVGQGMTDGAEIGLLTAKATVGFGAVLVLGSCANLHLTLDLPFPALV